MRVTFLRMELPILHFNCCRLLFIFRFLILIKCWILQFGTDVNVNYFLNCYILNLYPISWMNPFGWLFVYSYRVPFLCRTYMRTSKNTTATLDSKSCAQTVMLIGPWPKPSLSDRSCSKASTYASVAKMSAGVLSVTGTLSWFTRPQGLFTFHWTTWTRISVDTSRYTVVFVCVEIFALLWVPDGSWLPFKLPKSCYFWMVIPLQKCFCDIHDTRCDSSLNAAVFDSCNISLSGVVHY